MTYNGNIAYFAETEFGPKYFRLGMTKNGRSPYERWDNDSDYRKCGNPRQYAHEFYEIGECQDHDIHKLLKKTPGFRVASSDIVRSPEVFECDLGAEYAKSQVENFIAQLTGKAQAIRKPLDLRPYQQKFVDQFLSTSGDFLLFAKCRSGKSAMTLMAATDAGYNSILVSSYRLSAANSWRSDAVTYTKFQEWDVVDLSGDNWKRDIKASQKAGRRQVLISTVQRQNEKFPYLRQLRDLYPEGIDLLALDECHIGGESDQFKKLKQGVPYGRLLEISGTAYKSIWKYPRENVFVWGYVEEQKAKAEGYEWAQKLPRMELVLAKYNAEELGQVYGEDPDALKNVFSIEDGKWLNPGSVNAFLQKFFAYGKVHKRNKMLHGSQHIVMTLPSVECCNLFASTIEQFGSPFAPLVITGDSGNGQSEILEHVRTHEATICLTRWANVVGVTVPQWDTVMHGCEYQSAEFWVQFAFRGGSTPNDSWKVIDFAPERAVQSIVEMATVTANVSEDVDSGSVLRTFLEFADVFEFTDSYNSLDYGSVLNLATENIGSAQAAVNSAVAACSIGENAGLMAYLFEGTERMKDLVQIREQLNGNDTNGDGNVALERQGEGTRNEDNRELKKLLLSIKAAISKTDDVIMAELMAGNEVSSLPQLLSCDTFEMFTQVEPEVIRQAIESGWVNERALGSAVSQSYLYLSASWNRA
jgi:hypothetical protein